MRAVKNQNGMRRDRPHLLLYSFVGIDDFTTWRPIWHINHSWAYNHSRVNTVPSIFRLKRSLRDPQGVVYLGPKGSPKHSPKLDPRVIVVPQDAPHSHQPRHQLPWRLQRLLREGGQTGHKENENVDNQKAGDADGHNTQGRMGADRSSDKVSMERRRHAIHVFRRRGLEGELRQEKRHNCSCWKSRLVLVA